MEEVGTAGRDGKFLTAGVLGELAGEVRRCHSLPLLLLLLCRHPALNIWTPLIKSYLNSLLLSLTDSKVIKLLKGVAGKSVVSRLKRERLIKRPLLLLTSSKSAFFSARRANVRECGFFFSSFLPFFILEMCAAFSFFHSRALRVKKEDGGGGGGKVHR